MPTCIRLFLLHQAPCGRGPIETPSQDWFWAMSTWVAAPSSLGSGMVHMWLHVHFTHDLLSLLPGEYSAVRELYVHGCSSSRSPVGNEDKPCEHVDQLETPNCETVQAIDHIMHATKQFSDTRAINTIQIAIRHQNSNDQAQLVVNSLYRSRMRFFKRSQQVNSYRIDLNRAKSGEFLQEIELVLKRLPRFVLLLSGIPFPKYEFFSPNPDRGQLFKEHPLPWFFFP
ncbi:hypothetical protein VNO77_27664 [Canavalia gladiata]|uniref:Uncharacterized protein n=1 Tax=Canavalia gladiata TaxID=3824 RepID=A0AAN9Q6P7_CANGL